MKTVTFFYLTGCPYCAQARKALDELYGENPAYRQVPIEAIEEEEHPDIADRWDYWAVPSMFVGTGKLYEAHIGERYPECKAKVKAVLDAALA